MNYFQVILPLKLSWLPYYASSEPVAPGDRVRLLFSGKEYIGVVESLADRPEVDPARIRPILGVEPALEPVTAQELAFWHFLAAYTLCTLGEVYHCAYPATRTEAELRKARRRDAAGADLHPRLDAASKDALKAVLAGFDEGKPVLLQGGNREKIYAELVRRGLDAGKSVLLLSAGREAEAWEGAALCYTAASSASARRNIAAAVRAGGPVFVAGGPAALLLPWSTLGLIIVDAEDSPLHRREMSAPRFNARDAAVWLARQCGASILLGSDFPSLESALNASSGKYVKVDAAAAAAAVPEIIDTAAEREKFGMNGAFSLKLLGRMRSAFEAKQRVLLLLPWKDTDNIEIEARALFPKAATRLTVLPLRKASRTALSKYGLVALLSTEFMLKGEDFRTDEKAFRLLSGLCRDAGELPLLIQCAQAEHPVLRALLSSDEAAALPVLLLRERAAFGLPPYSRIVDVVLNDKNEKRLRWFLGELVSRLESALDSPDVRIQPGASLIRLLLPRDSALASRKRRIQKTLAAFCDERRYAGHIIFEVDPI
ncbi:MAG: hypothetical protein IJS62_02055 [Bacteroidales bacterium]|nr:hypothetical protein [Bacteroidales bacterium]